MNDAIWAIFLHYKSTNDDPQHHKCPAGADSWCEYQKALATTGIEDFHHDYEPFPDEVITAIEPIYEDLSKDELLQRCVGGFTQNNNESLNQLIWRISPKILASSPTIIEIAANAAACTFNEGYIALLAFLEEMKISVGPNAHEYVKTFDESRILKAEEGCASDKRSQDSEKNGAKGCFRPRKCSRNTALWWHRRLYVSAKKQFLFFKFSYYKL